MHRRVGHVPERMTSMAKPGEGHPRGPRPCERDGGPGGGPVRARAVPARRPARGRPSARGHATTRPPKTPGSGTGDFICIRRGRCSPERPGLPAIGEWAHRTEYGLDRALGDPSWGMATSGRQAGPFSRTVYPCGKGGGPLGGALASRHRAPSSEDGRRWGVPFAGPCLSRSSETRRRLREAPS